MSTPDDTNPAQQPDPTPPANDAPIPRARRLPDEDDRPRKRRDDQDDRPRRRRDEDDDDDRPRRRGRSDGNSTTNTVLIVLAVGMFVMCGGALLVVVCIAAISTLGQNSTATFSAVGSSVKVAPRTVKSTMR